MIHEVFQARVREHPDAVALIHRDGVTTYDVLSDDIALSPAVIADEDVHAFAGLDTLVVGGERLSARQAGRILRSRPEVRLVNGYGPVESTMSASGTWSSRAMAWPTATWATRRRPPRSSAPRPSTATRSGCSGPVSWAAWTTRACSTSTWPVRRAREVVPTAGPDVAADEYADIGTGTAGVLGALAG